MFYSLALILAGATAVVACDIPGDTPSNNIAEGFALQVQNPFLPDVHNHYMNLWDWGGGDQHLFVSPAGNSTNELTLVDGVITLPWDPIRRAVINGEYEVKGNTTKMFMTERGDPRAIFDVAYGCNPDTDTLQIELVTPSRGTLESDGNIGVRPFNGMYDFRWTPAGNTAYNPDLPWTKVTLVVVFPA